jgi:hypothetical protein
LELFSHASTICRVDREKESSSSSAAGKVIVSTVPQNAAAAATHPAARLQLSLQLGMRFVIDLYVKAEIESSKLLPNRHSVKLCCGA